MAKYISPFHRDREGKTIKPEKFSFSKPDKFYIEFNKSCYGTIITQTSKISPTEILRGMNYVKSAQKVDDIWLKDFITNISFEKIYENNKQKIFEGSIKLDCIIKTQDLQYLMKASHHKYIERKKETKINLNPNALCKLDKTFLTSNIYEKRNDYYKDLINSINRMKQTNFIFVSSFVITHSASAVARQDLQDLQDILFYIICPVEPFPFEKYKTQLDIINSIIAEKEFLMINFLENITFRYYLNHLSINDLFNNANIIEILQEIKINIKQFYDTKFLININPLLIYIRLSPYDTKESQRLVFLFSVIQSLTGIKYEPFTTRLKSPSIDELISRKDNLWFYSDTFIFFNPQKERDCIDDEQEQKQYQNITKKLTNYTLYNNTNNTIANKFKLLFGIEPYIESMNINVLSHFNFANKYHTYCSIFLLVEIGQKYFEVSIKSVTFDALMNDPKFLSKYKTTILSIINDPKKCVITREHKLINYYLDKLDAKCQIYVENIPNINTYKIPITFHYVETAADYQILLAKIKASKINEYIILILLWFNQLINLYNILFPTNTYDINKFQINILLECDNLLSASTSFIFSIFGIQINIENLTKLQLFASITHKLLNNNYYYSVGYSILGLISYHTENFIKCPKILSYSAPKDCAPHISFVLYYIQTVTRDNLVSHNKAVETLLQSLEQPIFKLELNKQNNILNFMKYVNTEIKSYNIWFMPSGLEINLEKLNIYLSKQPISISFASLIQNLRNKTEYDKNDFNIFCNFYTLFADDTTFLYNYRHLTPELKIQIQNIISHYNFDRNNTLLHTITEYMFSILHINIVAKSSIAFVFSYESMYNTNNIVTSRYMTYYEIINSAFTPTTTIKKSITIPLETSRYYNFTTKKFNLENLSEKLIAIKHEKILNIDIQAIISTFC